MASISVGTVAVKVVPTAAEFTNLLRAEILDGAKRIGEEVGKAITAGIGNPITAPMAAAAKEQTAKAPKDGDTVAGAFAKGFKARLEAAFKSLPKAEIEADPAAADAAIDDVRIRLEELSSRHIGIDITSAEAVLEIEKFKVELDEIARSSPDVQVKLDVAKANAQLTAFIAQVKAANDLHPVIEIDADVARAIDAILGIVPEAAKGGEQSAGAFGDSFRARLEGAFKALPKINIETNAAGADSDIDKLRVRLQELSNKKVNVDIPTSEALLECAEISAALKELGAKTTDLTVKADIDVALGKLAAIGAAADKVNTKNPTVTVDAKTMAAIAELVVLDVEADKVTTNKNPRPIRFDTNLSDIRAGLLALGLSMLAVSTIPIGATIVGGLALMAPALGAAGAGFGSLLAVAKPAISNIQAALTAQTAAQTASTTATGAGAAAATAAAQKALSLAGAQAQLTSAERGLATAVANEAFTHVQSLQAVASAEQQLAAAQQTAANAQITLTEARVSEVRSLQDQANQVIDARLSVQSDVFNVTDTQTALTTAKATPGETPEALAKAQLAYDQAVQALKEERLNLARLTADQKAADKAGVEGSDSVRTARQGLALANEQVTSSELALANARQAVTRSDQQAADQVVAAQDAVVSAQRAISSAQLQGATSTATTAAQAYTAALAKLTPTERTLMGSFTDLRTAYDAWAKSLEPEVLPVLSHGLDVLKAQLPSLTQFVDGSAKAFDGLITSFGKAMADPFWVSFKARLAGIAPQAITDLGESFGNVLTGIAGIFNAFLPYVDDFLDGLKKVTAEFANWGIALNNSNGVREFMAYLAKAAPVVGQTLAAVGKALVNVITGLSGFGLGSLTGIRAVAVIVSELSPGEIQAAAIAFIVLRGAIIANNAATATVKAFQALNLTMTSMGTKGPVLAQALYKVGQAINGMRDSGGAVTGLSAIFSGLNTKAAAASGGVKKAATALSTDFTGSIKKASVAVAEFTTNLLRSIGESIKAGIAQVTAAIKGETVAIEEATVASGKFAASEELVTVRGAEATGAIAGMKAGAGAAAGTLGVTALAIYALGGPMKDLSNYLGSNQQSTTNLSAALVTLGKTGKDTGALLDEFQGRLALTDKGFGRLQDSAKSLVDPTFDTYLAHGFNQMFSWLPGVNNDVDKARGQFKSLDTTLTAMVNGGQTQQAAAAFGQLQSKLEGSGVSAKKINSLFPTYTSLVSSAGFATQTAAAKTQAAAVKTQALATAINNENTALSTAAGRFATTQQELIDFHTGLSTVTTSLGQNGKAFYGSSQQALNNRQSVLTLAGTVQGYSNYLVTNSLVTKTNVGHLMDQRDALIKVIEKFGLSAGAATTFADALVTIPKTVPVNVGVNATGQFTMKGVGNFTTFDNFLLGKAGGGYVQGPGGPRSDDIPTRLSTGEFVVNAPATAKYMPALTAMNNEGNLGTPYRGTGYAGGGLVGATIPTPTLKQDLLGSLDQSFKDKGNFEAPIAAAMAAALAGTVNQGNYGLVQAIAAAMLMARSLGGGGQEMVSVAEGYLGSGNKFSAMVGRPNEEWCFAAGTLVDTPDGNRPIEEIVPGTEVCTPSGDVIATSRLLTREKELLQLTALGVPDTLVTADHPYWAMRRTSPAKHKRRLEEPEWIKVGDLKRGDMIALPVPDEGAERFDPNTAYILGMYLADGCRDHKGRYVNISDESCEAERIVAAFKKAGYDDVRIRHNRTCWHFVVLDRAYYEQCGEFGDLAHFKKIPGEVFRWDRQAREAFLDGYMAGDGSFDEKNGCRATTVSRRLAHDLCKLVRSLDWVPNATVVREAGTMMIEGRTVSTRRQYEVKWKPWENERPQYLEDDGRLWVPIRKISKTGRIETVYDLTVPNEHAFIADGAHVSNCADFVDAIAKLTHNSAAIPSNASAPGKASMFRDAGEFHAGIGGALPGDIFFASHGGSGDIAGVYHTGIITKASNGSSLVSIAGNTGGNDVAMENWSPGAIAGFGRPPYVGGGGSAPYTGGSLIRPSAAAAQGWARQTLEGAGQGAQWPSLRSLWERESSWEWDAQNPSSGAYGIPQAYPASRLASAGSDWRDNGATQIKWGLDYIKSRYRDPDGAWNHEISSGWYDQGGVIEPGPSLVYNGTGQNEFILNHGQMDDLVSGRSGGTHYHAHMDGWTRQSVQQELRTTFQAMDISAGQKQRIGRRS